MRSISSRIEDPGIRCFSVLGAASRALVPSFALPSFAFFRGTCSDSRASPDASNPLIGENCRPDQSIAVFVVWFSLTDLPFLLFRSSSCFVIHLFSWCRVCISVLLTCALTPKTVSVFTTYPCCFPRLRQTSSCQTDRPVPVDAFGSPPHEIVPFLLAQYAANSPHDLQADGKYLGVLDRPNAQYTKVPAIAFSLIKSHV